MNYFYSRLVRSVHIPSIPTLRRDWSILFIYSSTIALRSVTSSSLTHDTSHCQSSNSQHWIHSAGPRFMKPMIGDTCSQVALDYHTVCLPILRTHTQSEPFVMMVAHMQKRITASMLNNWDLTFITYICHYNFLL